MDETLDVLAAHGIAGLTGILFIGFFAQSGLERRRRRAGLRRRGSSAWQALAAVRAAPVYAFRSDLLLLRLIAPTPPTPPTTRRRWAWTVQHGEEALRDGEGAILIAPESDGEQRAPVATL